MSNERAPLFLNLNSPPRLNQVNQWADYVELLAITSEDRLFSSGLLQDTETETGDLAIDREDMDVDLESFTDGLSGHGEVNEQEKLNRKWSDIRVCLSSRAIRFENAWPFHFNGEVLRADVDGTNVEHRLYVNLLVASALRYVAKTRWPEITSSLEEVGYQLFKKLMPESWSVKPFAAHQRIGDGYEGTLLSKLAQLASDLNGKLLVSEGDLDARNSGDGGVDLVAWHSMGDALTNLPAAFAQCGCSLSDIEHKQFEAHHANFNKNVFLHHPAANYYFAPQDLRRNTGQWEKQPGEVVMLDRARILYLARLYDLDAATVNWPHVNEAISFQRGVLA